MSQPTQSAARRLENGRLVYYQQPADAAFWDHHWEAHVSEDLYLSAEQGILAPLWTQFEDALWRHLPLKGRILEAGCGPGRVVAALRARGYAAEGVEWGEGTVAAAQAIRPDLPIQVGDVGALDVPDGFYRAYLSLGVMEHRKEGPEPFLKEAYRVLEKGGVMLVSVPCLHPLRRLKGWLGLYRGKPAGLSFYQYAYRADDFQSLIEAAGFVVLEKGLYDGYKGIKDEIPLLQRALGWRGLGWRLQYRLRRWTFAEKHLGHMVFFVCARPSQ